MCERDHMNTFLPKTVGITELRTKTREIFDLLKKEDLPMIVMRDSRPEAIILPYQEYEFLIQEKRRIWNARLDELAKQTQPYIASWLRKKGYNPKKVTGDQLITILEEDDKSSR